MWPIPRALGLAFALAAAACSDSAMQQDAGRFDALTDRTDGDHVTLIVCGGGESVASDGAGALCNPVSQTGCKPGEKCAYVAPDDGSAQGPADVACTPDGTQELGGSCHWPGEAGASSCNVDDCAAGLHCYYGTCRALCQPAAPGGCVETTTCPDLEIPVCQPSCSLLDQNCAVAGDGGLQGCYFPESPACVRVPNPPGSGPGASCTNHHDCAPGSGCHLVGETTVCVTYCDFEAHPGAADPHCEAGEVCAFLSAEAPTIGQCVAGDTSVELPR